MIGIVDALRSMRPGSEYALRDDESHAGLVWRDKAQTKPTEKQVNDEIARLQTAEAAEVARTASIKAESIRADLLNRLKTATPAQIRARIATIFPTMSEQQIDFLTAILLAIALDPRS